MDSGLASPHKHLKACTVLPPSYHLEASPTQVSILYLSQWCWWIAGSCLSSFVYWRSVACHAGSACAPKLHTAVTKKNEYAWQLSCWGLVPSLKGVRKLPSGDHGIPWTTIWACDEKKEELVVISIPNLPMQSFRICRWDCCFLKDFYRILKQHSFENNILAG